MDSGLLFWTAALANLAVICLCGIVGVRCVRRGEIARHLRAMKIASLAWDRGLPVANHGFTTYINGVSNSNFTKRSLPTSFDWKPYFNSWNIKASDQLKACVDFYWGTVRLPASTCTPTVSAGSIS